MQYNGNFLFYYIFVSTLLLYAIYLLRIIIVDNSPEGVFGMKRKCESGIVFNNFYVILFLKN